MRILKKTVAILLSVTLLGGLCGGLGYAGYRFWKRSKERAEKVRYTESERGDLKVILRETATLKPKKVVEIKSKVAGRILKLRFEAGAVIQAGSVIAELDREEYQRDLEIAGQELERAQQEWDGLLPFGELVTNPELISATKIDILVDRVLLEYGAAKVDYENMREMYARNLVSQKSLDDARQAFETAYVAYHQSVRSASKALTEAKVQYDQAAEELAETTILAPVDGVLTKLLVDEGELVQGTEGFSQGTSLAELADLSEMMAVVKLNEVDVGKVDLGHPVTMNIESEPEKIFCGVVDSIAPSGEEVESIIIFEVKVRLIDRFSFFKPEMTANADILVNMATDVVKIPLEAIREEKGKKKVTLLLEKTDSEKASKQEEAEAEKASLAQDSSSPLQEDFYRSRFAAKINFEEDILEIETGLTNELWAEVTEGVSEGQILKLPDPEVPDNQGNFF